MFVIDKLKSFMLPVSFCDDMGVLALCHEFGECALSWIIRVMCACASQQMRSPLYMWEVSDGTYGWEMLSERCRFEDVDQCKKFVMAMGRYGLASVEPVNGKAYVTCPQILEDAANYSEKTEKRRKAQKASVESRRKKAEEKAAAAD